MAIYIHGILDILARRDGPAHYEFKSDDGGESNDQENGVIEQPAPLPPEDYFPGAQHRLRFDHSFSQVGPPRRLTMQKGKTATVPGLIELRIP